LIKCKNQLDSNVTIHKTQARKEMTWWFSHQVISFSIGLRRELSDPLATPPPYPPTHFCIMCRMSETYQSKRERWQRMLELLPAGLRDHVSLRNVEAVAALTPAGQERLKEAVQAGLKRLPRAVEQLRVNPETSVADLLNPPAQPDPELPLQGSAITEQIQNELADLIQLCFPDMPRISAEALANADVLDIVRTMMRANHQLFTSTHLKTDFVLMALYGLMRQTLERLEEMIEDTPALRQAFDQSALPWKPNKWRNQNA
jgi:hypothetical protein